MRDMAFISSPKRGSRPEPRPEPRQLRPSKDTSLMKKVHHPGKTGHGESTARRSGSCAEDCARRADVQRGLEKKAERGGGGSSEAAAATRISFQQTALRERLDPRV